MLGRSTTCKKDQKGEGVEKEVEKASMGIPQELIKKSQWNPVLVIIQESIGKIWWVEWSTSEDWKTFPNRSEYGKLLYTALIMWNDTAPGEIKTS